MGRIRLEPKKNYILWVKTKEGTEAKVVLSLDERGKVIDITIDGQLPITKKQLEILQILKEEAFKFLPSNYP